MKDSYSKAEGEDDEVSIKAVSDLMYACGMSLDMGYTQYQSWVNAYRLPRTNDKKYFNIPRHQHSRRENTTVCMIGRIWYISQLSIMLRSCILLRPHLGNSSFVCDGYDGKGISMSIGDLMVKLTDIICLRP